MKLENGTELSTDTPRYNRCEGNYSKLLSYIQKLFSLNFLKTLNLLI